MRHYRGDLGDHPRHDGPTIHEPTAPDLPWSGTGSKHGGRPEAACTVRGGIRTGTRSRTGCREGRHVPHVVRAMYGGVDRAVTCGIVLRDSPDVVMSADLSPIVTATAQWLTRAYPGAGVVASALAEVQARQAVTVAAWLRYPTSMDAALVIMAGPGGSARLDRLAGAGGDEADLAERSWRSWVDEVVASWAVCFLTTPALARAAVAALAGCEHAGGVPVEFRRLVAPDVHDLAAAALLRHPDLVQPVASLHEGRLLDRLRPGTALAC